MNSRTEMWLGNMYMAGKEFGFDVVEDNPKISLTELESEIYNYLMTLEDFMGYHKAVDSRAKMAAERVYEVTNRKKPSYLLEW